MVVDLIYDVMRTKIPGKEAGCIRCINCGNVEDAVICANRLEPRSRQMSRVTISGADSIR